MRWERFLAWLGLAWSILACVVLAYASTGDENEVPTEPPALALVLSMICVTGSYKSVLLTVASAGAMIAFVVIKREEFGIWFGGGAGLMFLAAIAHTIGSLPTTRKPTTGARA